MDRIRNFGFVLKDVSRLSSLNFERHVAALNLTVAQCKVLAYLQRHEGCSQARLAYLTDTDPMTLVRILDRMESDGWVERRSDPADRRARKLYLRPSAGPVLKEIWHNADRARGEAMVGLSDADRDQLMNLLERVHANLSALVQSPAEPCVPPAEHRNPTRDKTGPGPAMPRRTRNQKTRT